MNDGAEENRFYCYISPFVIYIVSFFGKRYFILERWNYKRKQCLSIGIVYNKITHCYYIYSASKA